MAGGVERRDFLRALGRTLRHPIQETERLADDRPRLPPEQVLVLGAGAAGLGAARALAAEDVAVAVLEARQRVGGRAWTVDTGAVAIDLGAAFVHGTEGNPLADLAIETGAGLVATDVGATALLGSAGALSADDLDAALDRYDVLLGRLVAERDRLGAGASVADGLAAAADAVDEEVLRLLRADVGVAHAADLDRLALSALLLEARLPGDDALVPGGLGALLEILSEDLDVRLREEVEHVEHGGEHVRVHTSRGEYSVDRAIVALPLGVLASGAVSFDPPLPDEVVAALTTINPGRLTTVAALLEEPLLPDGAEFAAGPVETAGEVGAWAALDVAEGAPALVGWAAGSAAEALSTDDREAAAQALGALAERLGRPLPRVLWSAVARWGDDPHTLGGVSFVPVGVDPAQRRALGGLVSPRLLLAGEAGATEHPGTVHGALRSGEREAARCMDLMRASQ